jgi:hypothetical protein
MELKVTSPAFKSGEMIPKKYTCDGEDVSPPIEWSGIPDGTNSVALICDDPDAPMGTWVHWFIFNMPPDTRSLPEGAGREKVSVNGAVIGINDSREIGYGGPCPPSGVHRYYFRIYALDKTLDLKQGAAKKDLLKAMEGHILARGELMGKYKREP